MGAWNLYYRWEEPPNSGGDRAIYLCPAVSRLPEIIIIIIIIIKLLVSDRLSRNHFGGRRGASERARVVKMSIFLSPDIELSE